MEFRSHTDRRYEAELKGLHVKILEMGGLVEKQIAGAVAALVGRDDQQAGLIIDRDRTVNRMDVEIDDLCLRLLALHQPAARDLRLITTGLKITTDLERAGDMAVNICERILELNREPQLKPLIDIPRMADVAQHMLREHPSFALLYLMVVAQGMLGYGLTSVLGAIPAEIFEGRQFGTIFGTLMLGAIAGGSLGPWVTGLLHDRTGSYTSSFWIAIVCSVVSAVAIWRAAPRQIRAVAGRMREKDGP